MLLAGTSSAQASELKGYPDLTSFFAGLSYVLLATLLTAVTLVAGTTYGRRYMPRARRWRRVT